MAPEATNGALPPEQIIVSLLTVKEGATTTICLSSSTLSRWVRS